MKAWVAAALLFSALPSIVKGQATITDLGLVPTATSCAASGVSNDGRTVTGYCSLPDAGHAFLWTEADGIIDLGVHPSFYNSVGIDLSGDGLLMLGSNGWMTNPFLWTAADGFVQVPVPEGMWNPTPRRLSADGSCALIAAITDLSVNTTGTYRYRQTTGIEVLTPPAGTAHPDAGGLSATGEFASGTVGVVGTWRHHAVRWDGAGAGTLVPEIPDHSSRAVDISDDGRVLAGIVNDSGNWNYRAWTWTFNDDGTITAANLSPANSKTVANAISGDGRVVVGRLRVSTADYAAVWLPGRGLVALRDHLVQNGVGPAINNWHLTEATAVSFDGNYIVGNGRLNGEPRAFLARLRPPCGSADFNSDGDTGTDQDIEAFFACLGGHCCSTCPANADFNNDGDTGTDQDIESFFRVLGGGPC